MTTDDLEEELRRLRPQPLSAAARTRIRAALAAPPIRRPPPGIPWIRPAAAALLLIAGSVLATVTFRHRAPGLHPAAAIARDIPGSILTLAQLQPWAADPERLAALLDAQPPPMAATATLSITSLSKDLP